jgi:hypothetical protein
VIHYSLSTDRPYICDFSLLQSYANGAGIMKIIGFGPSDTGIWEIEGYWFNLFYIKAKQIQSRYGFSV